MAVVVGSRVSNFQLVSNSNRQCLCGVGTGMGTGATSMASSSSSLAGLDAMVARISEAGTSSFRNFTIRGSVQEAATSSPRSLHSVYGAIFRKGRVSCVPVRCFRGRPDHIDSGQFGMYSGWHEHSGPPGSKLKASATKDSNRDVSRGDTRGKTLDTSRSKEEEEEEEEEEKEASHEGPEQGILLSTDSDHSKPEEESVIHRATTGKGKSDDDGGFGDGATIGTLVAGLGFLVVVGGFGAAGFLYKDQINVFLDQFTDFIEGYGSAGYGIFVVGYALLELIAIPAIPLTMSAGLLFGVGLGTALVSLAGVVAATAAFLIARYVARNRLLEYIKDNKKFMAIDKAIGEDGFRVVALLRLSPLLPFSLGNYLYGLTSVELVPYVLGSWLGMLPGTWAYVSAGAIGRSFIQQEESEPFFSGRPEHLWTLALGVAVTAFAATYITRVAKEALKDIEEE